MSSVAPCSNWKRHAKANWLNCQRPRVNYNIPMGQFALQPAVHKIKREHHTNTEKHVRRAVEVRTKEFLCLFNTLAGVQQPLHANYISL